MRKQERMNTQKRKKEENVIEITSMKVRHERSKTGYERDKKQMNYIRIAHNFY